MRAAVLGTPIAHSLSPVLHRAGYAGLGLADWSYEAIGCDAAALPGLLAGLDARWAGLSLTMPLKRAVLPLLDEMSEVATRLETVNTVTFPGGRRRGDNTDVHGIRTALAESWPPGLTAPRTLLLGAGATACSALAALHELGVGGPGAGEVTVAVRDPARTATLRRVADRIGATVAIRDLTDPGPLPAAELLVSTLPPGAADALVPALLRHGAPRMCFDVGYHPWPSALIAAAGRAGARCVGGLPMLVHQAAAQLELMTGRRPAPVDAMRAAGERELAARTVGDTAVGDTAGR